MSAVPFKDPRWATAYRNWLDKLDPEYRERVTGALDLLKEVHDFAEAARVASLPPRWLDVTGEGNAPQREVVKTIRALPVTAWPEAKKAVHDILRGRFAPNLLVPSLAGATGLEFGEFASLDIAVRMLLAGASAACQ